LKAQVNIELSEADAATQIIIKTISDTTIPDDEKFAKTLKCVLDMEDTRSSGPDTFFKRIPNWYSFGLVFFENYIIWGDFPPYKNLNLEFLKTWEKSKCNDKLKTYIKDLGYLNKDGFSKKRKIAKKHRLQILEFATELYKSCKAT